MRNFGSRVVFTACLLLALATFILVYESVLAAESAKPKEITIGWLGDMSGPVSSLAKQHHMMSSIYFDYLNKQGGIDGVKIKMVTTDTHYQAPRVISEFKRLMMQEPSPLAILTLSSHDTETIKDRYKQNKVPVIANSGSIPAEYPPGWVFCPWPTYAHCTCAFVDYYLEEIWPRKGMDRKPRFAWLTWDNAYGRAPMILTNKYLAKNGLEVVATEFTAVGAVDTTAELMRLERAGADVILSNINAGPYSVIMKDAVRLRLKDKIDFYDGYFGAGDEFIDSADGAGEGHYVAIPHEFMRETSVPGIALMHKLQMDYHGKVVDHMNCFGGITGALLAEDTIRAAVAKKGWPITGQDVYEQLRKLDNYDPMGVCPPLTFGERRYGHTKVYIGTVKGNKYIKVDPKYIECPQLDLAEHFKK
jgi:branched-chain amino acid transport system substrate-binding protein